MGEVKGISQFAGIIAGAKKVMDDGKYAKTREYYYNPQFIEAFGRSEFDHRRAIELGMCGRLVENMCANGAKPMEFRRVVLYAFLCIDAVKHQLDIFKAADDLEIQDLAKKYMSTNTTTTKEETK